MRLLKKKRSIRIKKIERSDTTNRHSSFVIRQFGSGFAGLGLTLTSMPAQKTLHHRIMQFGPECFNRHVVTGRMDSVGQHDHHNKTIQIHPKRGSCETKMTHTVYRKIAAGARVLPSRSIKAKGLVGIRQSSEE